MEVMHMMKVMHKNYSCVGHHFLGALANFKEGKYLKFHWFAFPASPDFQLRDFLSKNITFFIFTVHSSL